MKTSSKRNKKKKIKEELHRRIEDLIKEANPDYKRGSHSHLKIVHKKK